MESVLSTVGASLGVAIVFELCFAFVLSGLPLLGNAGKNLPAFFCYAPGLDMVVSLIIWVPWVVSGYLGGWAGLVGCVLGQIAATQLWIAGHERLHAQHLKGPRIQTYIDQRFGWWRNQLALWVTAVVVPVFFLIRFAEIAVYPGLIWLLGFKTYNHRDWINVSRHKFEGLVGADLIWCLYCDWMTGVYSLGAEMLRNVESFWCPIRFYYDKKCENCSIDFPDINGGWVAADGTLDAVVDVLDTHMENRSTWSWFGDPDRAISDVNQSSKSPE